MLEHLVVMCLLPWRIHIAFRYSMVEFDSCYYCFDWCVDAYGLIWYATVYEQSNTTIGGMVECSISPDNIEVR